MQEKIAKYLKEYQTIPNVPFMQRHTTDFITKVLSDASVAHEINDHYILIKPNEVDNEKPKILIMSHLDHPGIILENNRQGILMGLIGTEKFSKFVIDNEVNINVYSYEGVPLGQTPLERIIPGPKQKVEINAGFEIPKNSMAMLDITQYEETEDYYKVYNADDGAAVATMLSLATEKVKSSMFSVYFAFMMHEEVHQLSAWELAKTNPINLNDNDFVLNLECLKVDPIDSKKYGNVSYEDGLVLQLSNSGCLFGYKNDGRNQLELILKNIAKEKKLQLQEGLIKDSCDSRPFTQFGITSNICTLTIPNKYKHNGADDGNVRPEEVYKKDLLTMYQLVRELVSTEVNLEISGSSTAQELKENGDITDFDLMKRKEVLNNRLEIAFGAKVKRGHYYPENILESITDFVLKSFSYLKYYYLKLLD